MSRLRRTLRSTAAMLASVASIAGGQATISGRVTSARTGEPVVGATVLIVGTRVGAVADTAGRYSIAGLPAGSVTVRARFIGFADADQTITLGGSDVRTVDFALADAITTLNEVRTEAKSSEREVFESRPNVGVTLLTGRVVSSVPRLGETDLLRVAQMLPGVMARNDFTAGLNVRGGEADQNLILLDGYPIFNPFHMGGLFGTFIEGAVQGLELRTGGFPAPYGGRLSSVLDVKSTEDTRQGIHGAGALSMLATSAALTGGLNQGKGTWMLAARRTYADVVLKTLGQDVPPYFFRDAQAHATYHLGARTTLAGTFYSGRDDLSGDLANTNDAADGGGFGFWWGNRVGGLTLTRQLTDSLRFVQRASYSQFRTSLDLGDGSLRLDNSVRELGANGSLELHHGSHAPSIGYDVAGDAILYGATAQSSAVDIFQDRQRPLSGAGFVDDVWTPTQRVVLEGGVRYERLAHSGWQGFSPRLSAKYFITRNTAVTAAVGRYSQWLHSLAREDIPVRLFDFWSASDSVVPVSRATHFVLGGESWIGVDRFVRLETYVKKYDRLLEPNINDDPNVHGDEHLQLAGRSYGADLLVRQLERGRWGGWLAYTYTYSTRNGPQGTFYPGQDRRNNVNLLATYRPSERYLWSMRFNYATGTPYTDIVGQLVRRVYDSNRNWWDTERRAEDIQAIGGARNAQRLPATQRLDFTVTKDFQKGVKLTPFLSLINAYDAKNVFMYTFEYRRTPPVRHAYSQLPILPTIGVSFEW